MMAFTSSEGRANLLKRNGSLTPLNYGTKTLGTPSGVNRNLNDYSQLGADSAAAWNKAGVTMRKVGEYGSTPMSSTAEFGSSSGAIPSASPLKSTSSAKIAGGVSSGGGSASPGAVAPKSPLSNTSGGASSSSPIAGAVSANASSAGKIAPPSGSVQGTRAANFKYFSNNPRLFAYGNEKNKKKGKHG